MEVKSWRQQLCSEAVFCHCVCHARPRGGVRAGKAGSSLWPLPPSPKLAVSTCWRGSPPLAQAFCPGRRLEKSVSQLYILSRWQQPVGRPGGIPDPHREVGCTSPSVAALGTWLSGGCRPQTVPRNLRASGPVLRRLDCSAIQATWSPFFSQQRSSGSSSLCGSGHPNRQGRYQRRRLAIARVFFETRWVVFATANPLVSTTGNSSPAVSFLVCSPPHYHYTGRSPVSRPYTRLVAVFSGVVSSSAALPRTSASANRAGRARLATSSLDEPGSTFSVAVFGVQPRSLPRSNHFLPQPSAPRSTRETEGF